MISEEGVSNVCDYAVCIHTGLRGEMEDTYSVHTLLVHSKRVLMFGVYDGHNGDVISLLCRRYIALLSSNKYFILGNIQQGLVNTFEYIDTIIKEKTSVSHNSGCTSAVVIIDSDMEQLVIGNLGDCRVIGKRYSMVNQLTVENRVPDKGRLYHTGANFSLNVTKAIGDHDMKTEPQVLTCIPDIYTYILTGYSIIVIMTDGIHEYITNDVLMKFICERLHTKTLRVIAQEVVEYVYQKQKIQKRGDNMSVIIIKLR